MRRRRIAFIRRAMVMAAPTFITTCMGQTPAPEPAQTPPPASEASETQRPAGGIALKNRRNPPPQGASRADVSRPRGVADPRQAGAR